MLPADACALAQEFALPALVSTPRGADLGSDGFIAAAISPSAPAFPNSPNPLSRSVPEPGNQGRQPAEVCGARCEREWVRFHTQAMGASRRFSCGSPPLGTWRLEESPPRRVWSGGRARPGAGSRPDRSRAPGWTLWSPIPARASPSAHEVQDTPGPRGSVCLQPLGLLQRRISDQSVSQ